MYFQKIVFISQQSSQETIRVQKKQERTGQERHRTEERKQDYLARSQIYPIENRASKALSQLPYALTKIPSAAARPGSCFIISPSPGSGGNSFSPMLDFH